jgi:glycosyltransferase involved in cell wall biosynthesis
MINRANVYELFGGDTVQMDKTRRALEKLGVNVTIRLADNLQGGDWDYDIAHLFNIQTAEESWFACQKVKEHGLPLVLSTIYWDPLPEWFSKAPQGKRLWRVVRRALGYRPSYWLYASWQRCRYSRSNFWQTQRRLLRSADVLLPNSRAEASQLVRDFSLAPQSPVMRVIPNAIDRELYDPKPEPSPSFQSRLGVSDFVLQVGRVSPEKNSLELIEALWDVAVSLIFVGRPSPYDPGYVASCHERGAQRGDVHFVEWVEHDALPAIYAAALVHALPSWRETPGLASLEAAAAGCKIVSTSVGSAHEYLGDDAWYCHPADRGSIRKAVMAALHAPCSEKLRHRVLRDYTWDVAAAATLESYRAVLCPLTGEGSPC